MGAAVRDCSCYVESQHTALAIPLIACFWLRLERRRFPPVGVRVAATASILGSAVMMFNTSPPWYQTINSFNALFYKALPVSSDVRGDLASLGIDPAMARYAGQHSFLPDSPMQNAREVELLGRVLTAPKLARYYVSHPRIAVLVLGSARAEGSLQRVRMQIGARQYRLGNYEKSAGKPPEAQSHFLDFWTGSKVAVFGDRPVLYGAYAAGLLGALWIFAFRQVGNGRARMLALCAVWTAMVTLAAVLTMFDEVDTGRHLFLFNAMLDMTLCGVIAALSFFSVSKSNLREAGAIPAEPPTGMTSGATRQQEGLARGWGTAIKTGL